MIAAPLSEEAEPDADEGDWSKRELWALEDNLPRFSLSAGNMVLWRRMGIEVPELGARSPEELRARWLSVQTGGAPTGANPPCLENWRCVSEGTYEGQLYGVSGVADGSVSATVRRREPTWQPGQDSGSSSLELAELEDFCVVTSTGDVFQLGQPQLKTWDLASLSSSVQVSAAADTASDAAATAISTTRDIVAAVPDSALGIAGKLAGGSVALGAAAYAASILLGHHVDVSVFIV